MDDSDIFQTSRVLRSALRRGLRSAAAVTGCSAFTLADAENRFGLEPGRGLVIPNGVDLAGPTPVPKPRPRRSPTWRPGSRVDRPGPAAAGHAGPALPERPYILALGRVVEKKGFDLLLAAYAAMGQAARTGRPGDRRIGPGARRTCRPTARGLGIADRVHFAGTAEPRPGGPVHGRRRALRHAQPARAVRHRRPRGMACRGGRGGHHPGRTARVRAGRRGRRPGRPLRHRRRSAAALERLVVRRRPAPVGGRRRAGPGGGVRLAGHRRAVPGRVRIGGPRRPEPTTGRITSSAILRRGSRCRELDPHSPCRPRPSTASPRRSGAATSSSSTGRRRSATESGSVVGLAAGRGWTWCR